MDFDEIIQSLPPVNNIEQSLEVFKTIYDFFTDDDWLDYNNLFYISELIARYRSDLFSVGIRLNVQINLFLRTVYKYGSPQQMELIRGKLGCFALTENKAGVLSGLIVETTFTPRPDGFLLNTPQGVYKNFISQADSAEYVLIFAKNTNDKKDVRIFLVPTKPNRESNKLIIEPINSIEIDKTLDLCTIKINHLLVDQSCLLTGTTNIKKSDLLSSIYYGRMMIAEAVLISTVAFCQYCFKVMYTQEKFGKLPHITNTVKRIQDELLVRILTCQNNRRNLLDSEDVLMINVLKIDSVEYCINAFIELSNLFGTYALEYTNLKYHYLLINKIAEGDTDVLRFYLIHHTLKNGIHNLMKGPFSNKDLAMIYLYKKDYILQNFKSLSDKCLAYYYQQLP